MRDGWRVMLRADGSVTDADGCVVGRALETSDAGTTLSLVGAVPLRRFREPLFDLVARTTELLMAQASATDVSLDIVIHDGAPKTLFVDGEKIAWGIATLVGGALRYMADLPRKDKHVRVGAALSAERDHVVLSVIDSGPGIPKARLDGLLRRDARTQRAGGLALVLLRDVVVAHGGRMEVESSTDRQGHGTTVRLYLPLQEETSMITRAP
jgi:signal transduction histidine kinase